MTRIISELTAHWPTQVVKVGGPTEAAKDMGACDANTTPSSLAVAAYQKYSSLNSVVNSAAEFSMPIRIKILRRSLSKRLEVTVLAMASRKDCPADVKSMAWAMGCGLYIQPHNFFFELLLAAAKTFFTTFDPPVS